VRQKTFLSDDDWDSRDVGEVKQAVEKFSPKRSRLEPLVYISNDDASTTHQNGTGNEYRPNANFDYNKLSRDVKLASMYYLNLKRGVHPSKFAHNYRDERQRVIFDLISGKDEQKSQKLMQIFEENKLENGPFIVSSVLMEIKSLNVSVEYAMDLLESLDFCRFDKTMNRLFVSCLKELMPQFTHDPSISEDCFSHMTSDPKNEAACKLLAFVYKITEERKYDFLNQVQKFCTETLKDWLNISHMTASKETNTQKLKCIKDFLKNCICTLRKNDHATLCTIRIKCKSYSMDITMSK
jgi:hypothetical protein